MAASADFKLTNYPLRRLAAQIPTLSSPCLRPNPTADRQDVSRWQHAHRVTQAGRDRKWDFTES